MPHIIAAHKANRPQAVLCNGLCHSTWSVENEIDDPHPEALRKDFYSPGRESQGLLRPGLEVLMQRL